MSYINNPDITKEDILKKSLAHWNVGKTQEWIDRDMAIVMGKREGYYFWDLDGRKFLDIHINGGKTVLFITIQSCHLVIITKFHNIFRIICIKI